MIGEALIDIVDRTARVTGEHVGGSPLNVAVGLARLGRDVDFLTHIGDDPYGRRIVDYVKPSGVQLVSGSLTAERTTDGAGRRWIANGSAEYVFDIDWQLSGTPEVAPPLVAHTGSIAAVLEPGCLAVAALLDAYRLSATVTFDPNVRPSLIDDRDTGARPHRASRSNAATWSRSATRTCAGSTPTAPPSRSPRPGWRLGPSIVAVTMGDQGAFAMCAAGVVRVPARPVQRGRHRRRR